MQPARETAQQRAIREVRLRYERGDIDFDTFQSSLNILLQARNEDECQIVLSRLTTQQQTALAALEGASALSLPARPARRQPARRLMVAFIGEVQRMKRAWRLAENALCLALVGSVRIDLSLAALPPEAHIQVAAIVGEVTIYVPRSVEVEVRSVTLVGDVDALGERSDGIIAFGHEVSDPLPGGAAPESRLTIDALACVGEVRIIPVDGPVRALKAATRPALPEWSGD